MLQYPEHTNIEAPIPAPPRPRACNHGRYSALMDLVRSTTEWVAVVDLTTVAGQDMKAKVSTLHSAAFNRKMRIQSTVQHGYIYLKLVPTEVL
jgi:hypothetical protein